LPVWGNQPPSHSICSRSTCALGSDGAWLLPATMSNGCTVPLPLPLPLFGYHLELLRNTAVGYLTIVLPPGSLGVRIRIGPTSVTCSPRNWASPKGSLTATPATVPLLVIQVPTLLLPRHCGQPRLAAAGAAGTCVTVRLALSTTPRQSGGGPPSVHAMQAIHDSAGDKGTLASDRGILVRCSLCSVQLVSGLLQQRQLPSEAWGEVVDLASCHGELDKMATQDFRRPRRGLCLCNSSHVIVSSLDLAAVVTRVGHDPVRHWLFAISGLLPFDLSWGTPAQGVCIRFSLCASSS